MKKRPHPVQLLISGLAYGSSLLLGNIISYLLFEQLPPAPRRPLSQIYPPEQ